MKRYPLNNPIMRAGVLSSAFDTGGYAAGSALPAPSADGVPHAEQLVALAHKIGQSRHRRHKFFSEELFSEPGWEMLLALYRADAAGLRLSVSNLCRASGGPETTAVRWIDRLETLGMIVRRKSPHDGRVFFVELMPETRQRIQDYLMETWTSLINDD